MNLDLLFCSPPQVSLSDLNTETNGVIDWVAQLSHMFPTSGVVSSTRVVLLRRQYFQNMTAMITSLPDQDRNRMMHNYFIWRLAEEYIPVRMCSCVIVYVVQLSRCVLKEDYYC